MFELSKNININLEIFEGSKIYIIDNFYQDPDSVLNFFLNNVPDLWKKEQTPSYNGIYFEDMRHKLQSEEIKDVYTFLSFLCNQSPLNPNTALFTNMTKFKKCEFNDYKNNYWSPHKDLGYNGIVYFNDGDEVSGTNLYENLDPENEPPNCPEHADPWRSKDKWRLVKTLIPRYNRLVLFDGLKFFHSMNICNDYYFGKNYRFNQVFFFEQNY
jgi:hypothetical protein